MKSPQPPDVAEEIQGVATYMAMVVRNAMEDFHCEHLTDDQMKELNPIIRNAICTALHAFTNYTDNPTLPSDLWTTTFA